jgi:hypothetical protein
MSIVFADRSPLFNYLTITLGLTESSVEDALYSYFGTQGYTGALVDREKAYLEAAGYSTGSLEDRWVLYLQSKGYTSSCLPDLFRSALEDDALLLTYNVLLALNASNTDPLVALTGTNATQVATSSVVIPDNTGVLRTIPAGYPAIEGAEVVIQEITPVYLPTGATATPLASGLTRYSGATYSPGGNLGVMAEPSATNLALQSNNFAATWLQVGANRVALGTAIAGPLGTETFQHMIAGSEIGSYSRGWYQGVTITPSVNYKLSAYMKAGGKSWGILGVYDTTNGATPRLAYFDLANGVVGSTASGMTAAIEAYDPVEGAYKVSVVCQYASATTARIYVMAADADLDNAIASNPGDSYIYASAVQLQLGTAESTHIPTTTTTVTRGPRYTTVPGANFGTDLRFDAVTKELGREQWFIGLNATSGVYMGSDNKVYATDGTTTLTSTTTLTANTMTTIGVDWPNGVLYIGGVAEDTDAAMEKPVADATVLIGAKVGATNVLNGSVSVAVSSSDAAFDIAEVV